MVQFPRTGDFRDNLTVQLLNLPRATFRQQSSIDNHQLFGASFPSVTYSHRGVSIRFDVFVSSSYHIIFLSVWTRGRQWEMVMYCNMADK